MAATIKEIARLSGVSAGTVDRVLNNRGKVKPEVDKRVRDIAKALDYHPNAVAKSLVMRRKPATVGIISHVQPSYSNYAVEQAMLGIQSACHEVQDSGITFRMVHGRNFDEAHQVSLIDKMVAEGAAALAIAPINGDLVCKKIASLDIPVFCYTNDIEEWCPHSFVGIDNYRTGGIAAGLFHMIHPSLRNMAVVCSSLSMMGNVTRLQGFERRLHALYDKPVISCEIEALDDDFSSYKRIYNMLKEHPEVDSLFLMSGAVDGAIHAIQETGLLGRIPIVAIDLADTVVQHLKTGDIAATINQNAYQHGYLTIKHIYDYLLGGSLPEPKFYVNSEIVIRESLL